MDPDFERTEDERQREQEAEARALRAHAIALRRHDALVSSSCHHLVPCVSYTWQQQWHRHPSLKD